MKLIRSILLTCLVGLLPTAVVGQTIVWTDANMGRIQRKDVNGGEIQTIVQFQPPQWAAQIHYDPIASKLYYIFYAGGASVVFQRANLDGSNPESISTPNVGYFTLNVEARKLYWITYPGSIVNRSELDGSGAETHVYQRCCLLTLEAIGTDVFFGAGVEMFKGIWRADADGSNEQFLHGTSQPLALAYDPVENKIYCAAYDQGLVRMNTDGTGFQDIVPSYPSDGDQIVVDTRSRKLYWTDRNQKIIERSNLDGSSVEDFVTPSDAGNPNLDIGGLTLVDSESGIGACCDGDPFAPCKDDTSASSCQCEGCKWYKFQTCAEIECPAKPIPTASQWGLVVLALLLMISAKIVFRREGEVSRVAHGG